MSVIGGWRHALGRLGRRKAGADRRRLLRYLDLGASSLRAASGCLLLYNRRSPMPHPGSRLWYKDLYLTLQRLEDLVRSVEESQGWQDELPP